MISVTDGVSFDYERQFLKFIRSITSWLPVEVLVFTISILKPSSPFTAKLHLFSFLVINLHQIFSEVYYDRDLKKIICGS